MKHKHITKILVVSIVLIIVILTMIIDTANKKAVIGVILPLTGNLSKTGYEAKTSLEIAQDDFDRDRVELVFQDDAFSPKESVSVFNRFTNNPSMVGIIGPLNGSSIESVRTLAVNSEMPIFTPYGAGNNVGNYVYKNSVDGPTEAKEMAMVANRMGYRKLAIMYLNNDFGLTYLTSFKKAVMENGDELVAEESLLLTTNDFRTSILKIKLLKPDAVYLVHNSVSIAEIIKQASELDLKTIFLSQYAVESPELVRIAGKAVDGVIYTFTINETNLSERQKGFIAEYIKRTGEAPTVIAFNIYDIYHLYLNAIDECGVVKKCINNYLSNINDFDGISGRFSIKDNKLLRNLFLKTIKDGEFISVE